MNEEERKAFKVINTRTRRLLDELEIEKEDMSDEPKIAYLMQEIRANKTILNLIKKLQKENEKLENQEATARKINELLVQRYSNSIPVQKIKDKIEKLEQEIKDKIEIELKKAEKDLQEAIRLEKEAKEKEGTILWWTAQIRLDEKIKVLKEILKEVKKRWKWR